MEVNRSDEARGGHESIIETDIKKNGHKYQQLKHTQDIGSLYKFLFDPKTQSSYLFEDLEQEVLNLCIQLMCPRALDIHVLHL